MTPPLRALSCKSVAVNIGGGVSGTEVSMVETFFNFYPAFRPATRFPQEWSTWMFQWCRLGGGAAIFLSHPPHPPSNSTNSSSCDSEQTKLFIQEDFYKIYSDTVEEENKRKKLSTSHVFLCLGLISCPGWHHIIRWHKSWTLKTNIFFCWRRCNDDCKASGTYFSLGSTTGANCHRLTKDFDRQERRISGENLPNVVSIREGGWVTKHVGSWNSK